MLKRDSKILAEKNRNPTYSEHYLYWYYCYLTDKIKKMYTYIRQKGQFLKSCNTIRDKNMHTQVEMNRN